MKYIVNHKPIIVTYIVTSEYGGFETYYRVTVVDKDYNFSIIFEVYYGSVNNDSKKLELSRLHNHTIAITVTNFIALDALGNEMLFTENHAYPYPTVHGSSNIVSEVTMFYSGVNENNYKYRFGKNKSGYFNFDVYLPEDNLSYQITQDGNILQTTPVYGGKYYYIMHATRNRNKTFKLYIFETPEA